MSFVRRISEKYPFHPLVWYIIIETAFSRMAFFMAMPFLALRLHDTTQSSSTTIGLIVGIGPLVSIFASFWVGHLSDRFGRRHIIVAALFFWSFVLFGFSFATHPMHFAVLSALNGLSRGIFEPVTTALISDLCALNTKVRNLQKHAFHFRYFAINIGSSVGPVFGATILLSQPTLGFRLAAAAWFISAILFLILSGKWKVKEAESKIEKAQHGILGAMKYFARDRILWIYLLASFLIGVAYCQVESIFALHLKKLYGDSGVITFSRMITINGLVVVALTLPLLNWAKKYELHKSCAVSALFFAAGYVLMGISQEPLQYYFSIAIFTIGEIVIFANGNLMIESLAPPKMKGAYLGLSTLSGLSFVVGPALGGYLLETGGGALLFGSMSGVMIVVSGLYLLAARVHKKRLAS